MLLSAMEILPQAMNQTAVKKIQTRLPIMYICKLKFYYNQIHNYIWTPDNSILLFDIWLGKHDFYSLFSHSTALKETQTSVSYQDTTRKPVFLWGSISNNLEILKIPGKKRK